jgi:uncharacterized membrane protein
MARTINGAGWRRAILTAGIVLGLGLGGFFDGIVLHQILQWHHMISEQTPPDTLAGLRANTVADGLFHAATYLFTAVGLTLLWQAINRWHRPIPGRMLVGALLIGWGLFNVVEGIVNHHLLQLHHVRHGENELLWDLAFLAWGAAMIVGGWLLARAGASRRAGLADMP